MVFPLRAQGAARSQFGQSRTTFCRWHTSRSRVAEESRRASVIAMAKGCAKAKGRSSAAARTKVAQKSPAKAGATLLERMEAETPKQARRLRKRATDEAVGKILADHFDVWAHEQIDMTLRGGLSLRERLLADKKRCKDGVLTMGTHYYNMLREEYRPENSPSKLAQVENPSEPVDESLGQALILLRAHQGSKAQLFDWLEQDKIINQKNMVALLRSCCDIEPHMSASNCETNVEVLRYVARNRLDLRYPRCHELMRKHWDATLDKSWLRMRAAGLSVKTWWAGHEMEDSIVLDGGAFARCVACDTNWGEVAEDLAKLMHTAVGSRVFTKAFPSVASVRGSKMVDDAVNGLES